MDETLTLAQAGGRLGVDEDRLRRLVRTGKLPEASRHSDGTTAAWVIPAAALGDIARRNGWTIDVRDPENPMVVPSAASAEIDSREQLDPKPTVDSPADRRSEELALAQIVDAALLDRLLGAHEEKAEAIARSREIEETLSAANEAQVRTTEMLEIERRERTVAIDRLREEQRARHVADAKVAELRDRLQREMNNYDLERRARNEAADRSRQAEKDAATAVAAMGWLSRRRYRRLTDTEDQSAFT